MTVCVVLLINGGIPEDPEVFSSLRAAEGRFAVLVERYHLDAEDPHNEDYDLYLWPDMEISDGSAGAGVRQPDPALTPER